MPLFRYTAIDSTTGAEKTGSIDSAHAEQAALDLKRRGLFPTALAATGVAVATSPRRVGGSPSVASDSGLGPRSRRWIFGRVVSRGALAIFTRQLATLVNAGLPILRSLETLSRQERNLAFKVVIEAVAETIRSGGTLSDGLQSYPKIFDRLYINMVKAGEASGVLGQVLERLARFLEKAERIKGKVKAAMTYPAIISLVATGIVAALMVFVVPKFEQIFAGQLKGQPLPQLTQFVLGVSHFVKDHVVVTVGLAVSLWFVAGALRRTRRGIWIWDAGLLRLPAIGPLVLKAATGRFSRTFGTLLASGVPILQALIITRDTAGNVHLAEALDTVHDRVKEGDTVAGPLEATRIFPPMVTSMIDVGEETGALPEMLNRIADTYDEEVDNAVAGLTSIIEPIMIVLMAVMVGTIVIALFLPIVRIIQTLS